MTRRLRLSRETLAELAARELSQVNGASHVCAITDGCGHGGSIDAQCPTTPVAICVDQIVYSLRVCIQTA